MTGATLYLAPTTACRAGRLQNQGPDTRTDTNTGNNQPA